MLLAPVLRMRLKSWKPPIRDATHGGNPYRQRALNCLFCVVVCQETPYTQNYSKPLGGRNRSAGSSVVKRHGLDELYQPTNRFNQSQVADAKEMVEKSQALQVASGASVARLEETQEAYKGSVVALQERLEASVHEINRGNAIIQKLQGQYRALRSKAKLKSEVIKQQVT